MHILQVKTNHKIIVRKTKRPKFGQKKACRSDSQVLINGKEVTILWECMRGANYYFNWNGQWYKIPFEIKKSIPYISNLDDITHNDEWTFESEASHA